VSNFNNIPRPAYILPNYDVAPILAMHVPVPHLPNPVQFPVPHLLKPAEDLERYRRLLAASRPEVLVECGTLTGASAKWFVEQGVPRIVTIDLNAGNRRPEFDHPRITYLAGDTRDPATADQVRALVGDARAMVSLDSDHSTATVLRELELYAPLVSPGCYLVVEDGYFRWLPGGYVGDPLEALEQTLLRDGTGWVRDAELEGLFPVSQSPAGWWRRCE
jgi:cephalosporin hydroxylase